MQKRANSLAPTPGSTYIKQIISACDMHRAPYGAPASLAGFLEAVDTNKHLALDFWSIVARMSDEQTDGISTSAANALILETIAEAITGQRVAELIASDREQNLLVGNLASLLAGEDIHRPTQEASVNSINNTDHEKSPDKAAFEAVFGKNSQNFSELRIPPPTNPSINALRSRLRDQIHSNANSSEDKEAISVKADMPDQHLLFGRDAHSENTEIVPPEKSNATIAQDIAIGYTTSESSVTASLEPRSFIKRESIISLRRSNPEIDVESEARFPIGTTNPVKDAGPIAVPMQAYSQQESRSNFLPGLLLILAVAGFLGGWWTWHERAGGAGGGGGGVTESRAGTTTEVLPEPSQPESSSPAAKASSGAASGVQAGAAAVTAAPEDTYRPQRPMPAIDRGLRTPTVIHRSAIAEGNPQIASGRMSGAGVPGNVTNLSTEPARVVRMIQPTGSVGTKVVSSGLMAGARISGPAPIIPSYARGDTGTVVLHVTITKAGSVQNVKSVSGPINLRSSAMAAVRQWRYKPYRLNGVPTDVETTVNVVFSPRQ